MAKKYIRLSEAQQRKNELILRRLEEDRARLYEETRALQEEWNNRKRRRRRKSAE